MLIETNKESIGQTIKNRRKILKLTQFELAEKVGLNEKQISRIESGLNYPTYVTFARLVEALCLDISDFAPKDAKIQNKNEETIISIIKNSTDAELKIYLDILKPLRKNLKDICAKNTKSC